MNHVPDFIGPRLNFLFEKNACLPVFCMFISFKLPEKLLIFEEALNFTLEESLSRVDPVGALRSLSFNVRVNLLSTCSFSWCWHIYEQVLSMM
jgi:hypothetical protein